MGMKVKGIGVSIGMGEVVGRRKYNTRRLFSSKKREQGRAGLSFVERNPESESEGE